MDSGILLSEVTVTRSSEITQTFNMTMSIKATLKNIQIRLQVTWRREYSSIVIFERGPARLGTCLSFGFNSLFFHFSVLPGVVIFTLISRCMWNPYLFTSNTRHCRNWVYKFLFIHVTRMFLLFYICYYLVQTYYYIQVSKSHLWCFEVRLVLTT
jgi:hypothetical protein